MNKIELIILIIKTESSVVKRGELFDRICKRR